MVLRFRVSLPMDITFQGKLLPRYLKLYFLPFLPIIFIRSFLQTQFKLKNFGALGISEVLI